MPSKTVTKAQEAIQADKLLQLVASGVSVAAAGRSLDISERTAQRLYHRELRRYYEDNATLRQELVGRELKTLELMQRPMMKAALNGDEKAVDRVLAIMDRRSKYLGLDQAAKVSVEVSRVDDAVKEIASILEGAVVASETLALLESPGIG